jgi:biopolymer transport protein ExbB
MKIEHNPLAICGTPHAIASILLAIAGSVTALSAEPSATPSGRDAPVAIPNSESSGGAPELETPKIQQGNIPTKNLLSIMREGGLLMYPIGLTSVILTVFIFERLISLRRARVIPKPFVRRILEQMKEGDLDQDAALELCENNRSAAAMVIGAAVRKWGRPSVEVEQAILDEGERVANDLRRYIRMFNGISTLGPLLGLLGTVVGMISAFNAIAQFNALGRPEMLASGIGQALLTTAAGLCVAIPALIAQLYFTGRADRLVMELDALGQQVVGLIASDSRPRDSEDDLSKKKARTKAA